MNDITIFWFRRDLRLDDNHGLFQALKNNNKILPIFIFDKEILEKLKDKKDKRVYFIYNCLKDIKERLNELGSDLEVFYGTPKEVYEKIIHKYDVSNVYCNEDYEPQAIKRDKDIKKLLNTYSIDFLSFKDQCIFAKDDVLKADGKPYTVYTPFKNKWLEKLTPKDIASFDNKKFFSNFIKIKPTPMISLDEIGFNAPDSPFQDTRTIKKKIITHYDQTRDTPSIDGTSLLGTHLRFGTISPRKCAQIGYQLNNTWLSELVWREFFMQILYHFPHVTKGPFKEKYQDIKWLNSKSEFEKWCEGRTGFPIVDAGMRELNETGHMHNRVRMIAASFLVKDLLIDWRWGEKYFAQKLMDFDLSANNGNWQWVAGTGCDAAPYFRIFNPFTQQKKFDPDFTYIKKWVPEFGTDDYPEEMIDHQMAYHRAIGAYKKAVK